MAATVTLVGDRVRLTPMARDDAPQLLAAANEDRTTYGFTTVPATEGDARSYVEAALADQAAGVALPFTVRTSDGRVVGSSRFLDLEYWTPGLDVVGTDGVPTVGEIGSTWYAASVQRTGLNVEAKLLLLTHAFEVWQVVRVTLKTDARNERSRTAIAKIGAKFEGVRRAHMPARAHGVIRDTAYYSIVSEEWPSVRDLLRARLARFSQQATDPPSVSSHGIPVHPTYG